MVNQLSFFFFSFRASPHGWICGVVSTKTPSSIVLCLEKIALSKECNRMVKYQNGKVYKLLTKIRASLSVLCHLTSLLWSWRWANSSWNDCVGKNHVCRIENLHVMTVLILFKQWWDKIYIWTMTRFLCKDPEFVKIICFDIALQGSCWPLAAELHWSYE